MEYSLAVSVMAMLMLNSVGAWLVKADKRAVCITSVTHDIKVHLSLTKILIKKKSYSFYTTNNIVKLLRQTQVLVLSS